LLKNVRKPKNVSDKDYLFFVRLGKRSLAKKKKVWKEKSDKDYLFFVRFGKRRDRKNI
jgi:hypothetical protein